MVYRLDRYVFFHRAVVSYVERNCPFDVGPTCVIDDSVVRHRVGKFFGHRSGGGDRFALGILVCKPTVKYESTADSVGQRVCVADSKIKTVYGLFTFAYVETNLVRRYNLGDAVRSYYFPFAV